MSFQQVRKARFKGNDGETDKVWNIISGLKSQYTPSHLLLDMASVVSSFETPCHLLLSYWFTIILPPVFLYDFVFRWHRSWVCRPWKQSNLSICLSHPCYTMDASKTFFASWIKFYALQVFGVMRQWNFQGYKSKLSDFRKNKTLLIYSYAISEWMKFLFSSAIHILVPT